MLDLEQVTRAIDDAVAPVTADEARARAGERTHFRRTAVFVSASAALLAGAAIFAVLVALGLGRHSTAVRVRANVTTTTVGTSIIKGHPPKTVQPGDPIGKLVISKIDDNWIFVQGSTPADEAKGPTHDPGSALPGQPGNVVIAGHRTTHGAPFNRLDELRRGDVIQLTTIDGGFTYTVDGRFLVPASGDAIFPENVLARVRGRTRSLTLITNTPEYSAAQRLVVTAHA